MTKKITLSDKTKLLIEKVRSLDQRLFDIPDDFTKLPCIEQAALIAWLNRSIDTNKKNLFLLESLRLSILADMYDNLPEVKPSSELVKTANWSTTLKFILLALAGTIYVGCEGFDGISAILAITTLPSSIILISGLLFSLLSIMVFFAFDLVEISKNLGVQWQHTPKLVDVYLQQTDFIKKIMTSIDDHFVSKSIESIQDDLSMIAMFEKRYMAINDASQSLKNALDSPKLKIAKAMAAGIAGIIFFSGGYFVGQTVSLAIMGLFIASVTPAFWPVIVMSTVIGLAALSLYWFVERPGIENLIGRISGLDKDNIEALCDANTPDNAANKLTILKAKLESQLSQINKLAKRKETINQLEQKNSHLENRLNFFPQPSVPQNIDDSLSKVMEYT